MAGISIQNTAIKAIHTHAAAAHPQECCGILLGEGDCIVKAVPAANVHGSPQTHFELDPAALIGAHKAARDGGAQVLGYYHSHPAGPAEPSVTDRNMAAHDGLLWAIVGAGDLKLWRDDRDGFVAVSYCVLDG